LSKFQMRLSAFVPVNRATTWKVDHAAVVPRDHLGVTVYRWGDWRRRARRSIIRPACGSGFLLPASADGRNAKPPPETRDGEQR